ncbi:MobQ family relaxase [Brevundimonas sp. 374]|uniref:MobQ family relaxase n=1 Tax=Brevundimonas sp. 374 TaxID=1150400 RepID=UPI00088CA588|nr:MobQ family relaxase [Brevundimonas sp. 374]SDQ27871.1 MobA/MobL family protein [Brevundimonas sp. 374]
MSIFHLTVRSVSRASGRSAVAAAAYRAGERLINARDGRVHDYTAKPVLEAFIMTPDAAPSWAADRSQLWNGVEATEKRKDAKVAREYELALPAELEAPARRSLTVNFAELLIERYGVAVDVALHPPDVDGDQRNYHAHLLTTTRAMTPDGLGSKTRQLDVSSTASVEVENLRASWAAMINSALERAQIPDKVDHRSFERQGTLTEPTVKMGPVNTAVERRALRSSHPDQALQPVTARGQLNTTIKEIRALAIYIERGRAFIESETMKLVAATKDFAAGAKRLANLATLRRTAGNIAREIPDCVDAEPKRDRKLER